MRYLNARQMIFDAYRSCSVSSTAWNSEIAMLGVRIQTTRKSNNDWRIVGGMEAGHIISLVEALPDYQAALARYCFGPFTKRELEIDREIIERALYRQLIANVIRLPGQGKGEASPHQLMTLRYLCSAALHHHRETTWPFLRPGLPTPRAIKNWIKIEKKSTIEARYWSRQDRISWSDIWRAAITVTESWERDCLQLLLSSLREDIKQGQACAR